MGLGALALATEAQASRPTPTGAQAESEQLVGIPGEPGSGVGRLVEGGGDPNRLQAPLPRRPRNDDEARAIGELEELFERFEAAAIASEDTLRDQLIIEAEKGREELAGQYDREIREHRAQARSLRAKAITRYEDFLGLHPNDAAWTPEIMFRLAELHFESSLERYQRQEDAWQDELAALDKRREAGEQNLPDMRPPPTVDYLRSIELLTTVVGNFPNYALNDAALYRMGVLLYESEEFDASRQAFLALSCSNRYAVPNKDFSNIASTSTFRPGDYERCTPLSDKSAFTAESWLRVGELHYDVDELDPALEAYTQALGEPGSKLFAQALLRIAFTTYLKRDFPGSIARFDQYILYADSLAGTEQFEDDGAYRGDVIKWMAKTYNEDDWDGNGRRDRVSGIKRLEQDYAERKDEPHVPEIYAAYADLLAYETEFEEAVQIYELALARWPLAAAAPEIQAKILAAWKALREDKKITDARDKLATNYLRGTAWYYANENDPDAIERAFKLAEDALVATAVDHQARAQALRSDGDDAGAKLEYEIAARAYAAYLERFPNTQSSYDYRYSYADSLYYSDQYLEAAKQFAIVRDSNLDNRLQADASEGVVSSLEAYAEERAAAGEFALPDMPKDPDAGPYEPLEVAPLALALQDAYDRYAELNPDSEGVAEIIFKSGEISQRHNRFAEARPRFQRVIDRHCEQDVSINASLAIIDGYTLQGQLTEEILADMKTCGTGEAKTEFAGKLRSIGNAVIFQEATILFEAGEFEAAADRYVALVNQAPDDPNADNALNNAAVAYENIGRFESASNTYERIYTTYKPCDSPTLKDGDKCSEFADEALLRAGYNHSRFFEFEDAVAKYLILATKDDYKNSDHRLTALRNAAGLQDSLQNYEQSAKLYYEVANKADSATEKAEALYEAAEVLEKAGNDKKTIAAYKKFLKAHGGQADQAVREVEAHLRLGQLYRKGRDRKAATRELQAALDLFAARGLAAGTPEAALPAEAQFILAEYALEDVVKIKIKSTNSNKIGKEATKLLDALVKVASEYDKVVTYRSLDWVLAAMYRRAYAFESVATAVIEAPVPRQLRKGSEAYYAYKITIQDQMEPLYQKAIGLYEECVKRSKEFRINNVWTSRALERLNVYKADEYPSLRDPALTLELEDRR
ncbi:tetratricopeptide repeat protein [Enhygromyxa salina]|uniref:tetratricopeptide repeat protein n=1 Tax=Enhygromyxa salina TaxID=215803 RepID=UPI000D087F91|nr:tetratricopeptide repeat protein [Enhygromyxa salina]